MFSDVAADASVANQYHRQAARTRRTRERSDLRYLVRGVGAGHRDGSTDLPDAPAASLALPQPALAALGTQSMFDRIASQALSVSPKVGDVFNILLGTTLQPRRRGCKVLQPLWVEEAVHRAYNFVRLVDVRHDRSGSAGNKRDLGDAVAWEDAIACDLAGCFEALAAGGERDLLPCATILHGAVSGLVALFGCPANISLESRIDNLQLPGYKRRALVLATVELVCNALLHGFPAPASGQIEVHLIASGSQSACLRVADNGVGFLRSQPNLARGVASGLADLLEAELGYDRTAGWTIAEVTFPVSALHLGSEPETST